MLYINKLTTACIFLLIIFLSESIEGNITSPHIKISNLPFMVTNIDELNNIEWTMISTTAIETVYCVSENPVEKLRFVCLDCEEKNVTDILYILSSARDLTKKSGYPTIVLENVPANANWTGVTIICQGTLNHETIISAPTTVNVKYIRQPQVVDANGNGPILVSNIGHRFYVECIQGPDGQCKKFLGQRKTLKCSVHAYPLPTVYKWFRNGIEIQENNAEITIGVEMVKQSIQCAANNGLYSINNIPKSQAITIDPYTPAKVVQDNFDSIKQSLPLHSGNLIHMNQVINLRCEVKGNPKPIVYWKQKKINGEVVNAPCPQGVYGDYKKISEDSNNIIKLSSACNLNVSSYSFSGQYWCSACSYVSDGSPECSDEFGNNILTIQVQGPPMTSDIPHSLEKSDDNGNMIVTVNYCSDPKPLLPRKVIFSIDHNNLHVGQTWKNFKFNGTTENNVKQSCYAAKLEIFNIRSIDKMRQIKLIVQNTYGKIEIPVSLEKLLEATNNFGEGLFDWGIVFMILFLLCFLASFIPFCCYGRVLFSNNSKFIICTIMYKIQLFPEIAVGENVETRQQTEEEE
uniref:Ig-like domain-containing protein n=1 Tax=Parastrongyloides trichosuri TaxID=131310 RepID=A0A0N5A6Q3_PARTI